MSGYPKRLIEVDLPIKKISAHARREKSIRHGHLSTLHIWWARRPLAACRAVLCAALWPDPADPLCPQRFRDDACRLINQFAAKAVSEKALSQGCSHDTWKKWQTLAKTEGGLDPAKEAHWNMLRFALLDFIADFANWDNSTVPEYLETSRALTQSAHEALGGIPGSRPLVVDPFAGGGAIPLEALRVGADAFASDLNPVPVLLNKVLLEFIPKYGQRLADELRKWGKRIKQEAEKELAQFYPKDSDDATPIAYLWARTIRCEGPGCGVELPLIRATKLSQRHPIAHVQIAPKQDHIAISLHLGTEQNSTATIHGGKATCPRCGYTTPEKRVKEQVSKVGGGADSARLFVVLVQEKDGRRFREPNERDLIAVQAARTSLRELQAQHAGVLPTETINPLRPYKNTVGVCIVTRLGINRFIDLYTSRQACCIAAFQRIINSLPHAESDHEKQFINSVRTVLHLTLDRIVNANSSLSRWNTVGSKIEGLFSKQALQVIWDYAESNPLGPGMANWDGALEWVAQVIEANTCISETGTAALSDAADCPLPNNSADLYFTDPPYFAAIPYADLSDVFYVWLRRGLYQIHPTLFEPHLVDKRRELIVTNSSPGFNGEVKDGHFFTSRMTEALDRGRQVTKPGRLGCIVFADSTTASWEAMLAAVIAGGWVVTASWPVDTEMQSRTRARSSASLQSSVFMICRPRGDMEGVLEEVIGDWRDILQELPRRIHEWMPRLGQEGVVGADAIFSCLGPALEIFSRYSRVEKPSGDQVSLREYLEYVWAAVSKEAVSMIFAGADTSGFEEDARLTAMWLWTLSPGLSNGESTTADETEDGQEDADEKPTQAAKLTGFTLEYDAARKIAQGLGAHLELLVNLVEVKGEIARLLPVAERTKALFGKEGADSPAAKRKKSAQLSLPGLLEELEQEESGWTLQNAAKPGSTTLDRLHQAMILFAAGRGEGLRRFLVDDGVGKDQRFWSLAQSLCALYPSGTDERRWSEGVLARKKGLGL